MSPGKISKRVEDSSFSQFLDETGKENPSNHACPVGRNDRTGVNPV